MKVLADVLFDVAIELGGYAFVPVLGVDSDFENGRLVMFIVDVFLRPDSATSYFSFVVRLEKRRIVGMRPDADLDVMRFQFGVFRTFSKELVERKHARI